jgi:hypothetical protein
MDCVRIPRNRNRDLLQKIQQGGQQRALPTCELAAQIANPDLHQKPLPRIKQPQWLFYSSL